MDHQQEMAYGESNGHVIESHDGDLSEVSAVSFFTVRCTVVQITVLRSHVVHLSVCDVG